MYVRCYQDCPGEPQVILALETFSERLALHCSCVTSNLASWLKGTFMFKPMAWLYNQHSGLAAVSSDVCHGRQENHGKRNPHSQQCLVCLFTGWWQFLFISDLISGKLPGVQFCAWVCAKQRIKSLTSIFLFSNLTNTYLVVLILFVCLKRMFLSHHK